VQNFSRCFEEKDLPKGNKKDRLTSRKIKERSNLLLQKGGKSTLGKNYRQLEDC